MTLTITLRACDARSLAELFRATDFCITPRPEDLARFAKELLESRLADHRLALIDRERREKTFAASRRPALDVAAIEQAFRDGQSQSQITRVFKIAYKTARQIKAGMAE